MSATCTFTYIGGPTALIDVLGLRLLTDPTFDPPGRHYSFGFGTGSTKTQAPTMTPAQVGAIDAVLLSHDQHEDNLDTAGREVLAGAPLVVTTQAAARRLGARAVGLGAWESTIVSGRDGEVKVTATPGRHGNLGSHLLSGPVVGFLLEWPGQEHGALYISGDTVWYGALAEIPAHARVGVAVIHFGAASFPISGPARFTFNPVEGLRTATLVGAHTVVPIHYEGWSHFHTPRPAIEAAFTDAGQAGLLKWAGPAVPLRLEL